MSHKVHNEDTEMTTATANKSTIAATITGDTLSLTFANGKSLAINRTQLTDQILDAAMMHGLKQKLVDAAAISRDTTTGRAATIETKYEAVLEVYNRLLAGEWNKRREGGAGATKGGLLARALVRLYAGKKTAEQIIAFLETKSDEEKAALRKNPKVAEIILELKAESAKTDGIDSDELLAGLDGDQETESKNGDEEEAPF